MDEEQRLARLETILAWDDVWERSRYEEIVPRWEKHLDSSRLMIGFFHEIKENPRLLMARVCEFLQIPFEETMFPDLTKKVFEGKAVTIPDAMLEPFRDRVDETSRYCIERFPETKSRW